MADLCNDCGESYDDCRCWLDDGCPRGCDDGMVVTCIDDMCRGLGECIHGDGYGPCRDPYHRREAEVRS